MLDKKLWPNLIYAVILFVVCATIWQTSTEPEPTPKPLIFNLYTSNSSLIPHPMKTLPLHDYHRLIDLDDFSFSILNLPCNDSAPVLLVLVHSDPKNFERRRIVRETWGQNGPRAKILFMTGLVKNSTTKTLLEKENEQFQDLVQGSFVDAYRNMTYKHVMVFKYAIYHCPTAKYILKTDDDVFVNMPLMLNFLTVDLSPYGGADMLFCTLRKRSQVIRTWRSKWRVSFKEYPSKMYPPYCPGWAVLYSPDVVFDLYREAQKSGYFWIDDVHVTGTLVQKIGLKHVNIDHLVLGQGAMMKAFDKIERLNVTFLYGRPNLKIEHIKKLWDFVKDINVHPSVISTIS